MHITQVIAFLAVAIVGAIATPGGRQPPPPPPPPSLPRPTSIVQTAQPNPVIYMPPALLQT
jgi:hypothetical protein